MIVRERYMKRGFTMVELMLAMAFLATLLITIALLIMQVTTIYQKGLSIKAVNSVGKQLIDEFTRSVASSPIVDINSRQRSIVGADPDAENKVMRDYMGYFFQNYATIDGVRTPINGMFCTGKVSYIWNTGYAIKEGDSVKASYRMSPSDDMVDDFRLIRVDDTERDVCNLYKSNRGDTDDDTDPTTANPWTIGYPRDPIFTLEKQPLELLTSDGITDNLSGAALGSGSTSSDLALYDFRVFPGFHNVITGQTFYSATFILATVRGGVNIFTQGDFCTDPPNGLNTDFAYCAINKFNFAMRVTGTDEGDGAEDAYGSRDPTGQTR